MKKRPDGRYQKNIYIGTDSNGKKKYKTVFGKTQKEVNQKATEIKLKLNKGIDVCADNDTFGEWIAKWKQLQKTFVGETHYNTYDYYLKPFEELFDIKISKLQVSDFQMIINHYAESNPHTNKPTAKATLKDYKVTASQVFKFAIKNRAIDFNPIEYVEIPKNAPKKKRRALTKEEQQWIMNTPHKAQLPAMIMMLAGLRLGECLALQWCDIDLTKKTIHVTKTLVNTNSSTPQIKNSPKTKSGIRTVDIPNILVEYLKKQHFKSPFDYVVTNTSGRLMSSTSWKKMWNSYLIDLNIKYGNFSDYLIKPMSKYHPEKIPFVIERFTAHYLRHTHATNLFKAGYDVLYIQHQLGHSTPETTLNIYTHLVKENKTSELSKLDSYLAV